MSETQDFESADRADGRAVPKIMPLANAIGSATGRIREISELFEISASTIKFYEAKGLLKPQRDGGQRLYNQDDCDRLEFILKLKSFDFSIGEIKTILEKVTGSGKESLDAALTATICAEKVTRLQEERQKIDRILALIEEYRKERADRDASFR